MRLPIVVPALALCGLVLAGCSTSATPEGVLPRDPVPPPPSMTGQAAGRSAAAERPDPAVQRRALAVPDRASTPRPSIEPVMTGSGAGAGFRF